MLCMKRVYRDNRRRYTGQQPATKSVRGPAAKPRMNCGSTVRCVPPPVYIGFPLFVLAKRRSGELFTVPWRARGTVAFRADRNVGTLFCPGSPRFAVRYAPCRPDPPVVCPGFPGHALHEKGLQRQIAVGTLLNSQQRRALAVPGINRG